MHAIGREEECMVPRTRSVVEHLEQPEVLITREDCPNRVVIVVIQAERLRSKEFGKYCISWSTIAIKIQNI